MIWKLFNNKKATQKGVALIKLIIKLTLTLLLFNQFHCFGAIVCVNSFYQIYSVA